MNAEVDPGVRPVIDDQPRMTAADADARFAALVAEHRAGKRSRVIGPTSGASSDRRGAAVLVLVFCLGVFAGAIFHVKPLLAIILGAPTVYFAHVLYKRSRDRVDAS